MNRQDWEGRVGVAWSEEWRGTERTFAALEPALEAAILAVAPERGRFLDIGCGVGTTTLAVAAARPAADVTGIDLSAEMIAVATERAAATANARFLAGDAVERATGPYDLLFSRHGVMFFTDPPAAFAALRHAAAPGAPLVFSCFRSVAENPWAADLVANVTGHATTTAPAANPAAFPPGPFAFADPAFVASLLQQTDWDADTPSRVNYDYVAGEGSDAVDQAVALLRRIGPAARALSDMDERDRPIGIERLRAAIAARTTGDRVAFPAAAWIWTAHAGDPA